VHVDDVNDHSPTFIFPNSVNNTVHITSAAVATTSPGHLLVAVCQATDADDGPNARVTYRIDNVSSSASPASVADLFRIGRLKQSCLSCLKTLSATCGHHSE